MKVCKLTVRHSIRGKEKFCYANNKIFKNNAPVTSKYCGRFIDFYYK